MGGMDKCIHIVVVATAVAIAASVVVPVSCTK